MEVCTYIHTCIHTNIHVCICSDVYTCPGKHLEKHKKNIKLQQRFQSWMYIDITSESFNNY